MSIQSQLNFYSYPVLMILGNIGNIFIVIFFSQHRQNVCSIYILCLAIINDIYLTYNGFFQMFLIYYTDQSIRAFVVCKIRNYLGHVLGQTAKTLLMLTCIDRYMITSNRVRFRAFSTTKRAKYFIFGSFIFWLCFASHIAIMFTIINGECNAFGTYLTIFAIYIAIFVSLIPPIVSGIVGYLTFHNMKQIHVRVQPIVRNGNNSIQRRDRELMILVISEVFIYVITSTPYALILLEMIISGYILSNKSIQYSQIENFIRNASLLLLFVNNAAPFYIYLIASKSFRRDFRESIQSYYRKLSGQQLVHTVSRINQTTERRET